MAVSKSQEQVLEGDIETLIAHRDYVIEKLHKQLERGNQAEIARLNQELGATVCDLGGLQRMLNERKERMAQHEQDKH